MKARQDVRLTTRAAAYLDEGEAASFVFMARSGVAPDERSVNPLAMLRRARNHIVVVTERDTLVLDATLLRSTVPVALADRSAGRPKLVNIQGLWAEVVLDDHTFWVHKRYHDRVKAAAGSAAASRPRPSGRRVRSNKSKKR